MKQSIIIKQFIELLATLNEEDIKELYEALLLEMGSKSEESDLNGEVGF